MKKHEKTEETMMKVYEIERVKDDTVLVKCGPCSACAKIAKKMDGTIGLTLDGTLYLFALADEVKAAINKTLVDGYPRTIQIGLPPRPRQDTPETGISGVTVPCPKCGTYCYGDCEIN